MKQLILKLSLYFSLACVSYLKASDLTVAGVVSFADGLGRIPIGIIDVLKNDLDINCIPISLSTNDLIKEINEVIMNSDDSPGQISLLCSPPWYPMFPNYLKLPASKIKLAYSMFESTSIPEEWVHIFNGFFDAVIVPDEFLVNVYKEAGVEIPIFELPLGMYLDEYLQVEQRKRPSKPFVFGTTVSCDERKNYKLLIEAFAEEFGNSNEVILKLNGRMGTYEKYRDLIDSLALNNIIFTNDTLTRSEYLSFLNSFDCFVNISKGEGFSLCPREALALGIPCILTNNTAQITLCNTGFVKEVPSLIPEAATIYAGLYGHEEIGYFYTADKEDIKAALRDVYQAYDFYLNKAQEGRKWVEQYNWKNIKNKYLTLVKPKKIVHGSQNKISEDELMTNSESLYIKYKELYFYESP